MTYDCIIIGCGPSGMTAGIYLARAGKKVLVFEKSMVGGQVALTGKVENYTGIKSVNGADLAYQMFEHLNEFGVEVVFEEVVDCDIKSNIKRVETKNNSYYAKTIYIATGAFARKLGVEGEREFKNKGISYCATCDGALYKNKVVAVVGGGNSAFEDCFYLADLVKKIYLIHRRDEFRGSEHGKQKLLELEKGGKVEFVLDSVVSKVVGDEFVKGVEIFNVKNKTTTQLDVEGIFVAIGRQPENQVFDELDNENGYILADSDMKTNVEGVFAGGDVIKKPLRQIVTATNDGAIASLSILQYLQ